MPKKAIDLSGDYVSNERDEAKIEKRARPGRSITKRLTARANLVRIGRSKGLIKFRPGKMKKSIGNTDFAVTVRV